LGGKKKSGEGKGRCWGRDVFILGQGDCFPLEGVGGEGKKKAVVQRHKKLGAENIGMHEGGGVGKKGVLGEKRRQGGWEKRKETRFPKDYRETSIGGQTGATATWVY